MRLTKKKKIPEDKSPQNEGDAVEENIADTLRWYDKQIEKNPKDTGLYYAKAALLAQNGQYRESIDLLDRIIELDENNQKVWYIKANTLFELHLYEESLACFDRILEFAEDDERIWYHKGEALSLLGRYKEAIECYDRAIELDRNFTEAWLGRGNALRKLRSEDIEDEPDILDEERKAELEEALDNFDTATEQNPYSEKGWCGKGNVLYSLREFEEAVPFYDRSLDINPVFIQGLYGRGKTLKMLHRDEEARKNFGDAVEHAQVETDMMGPDDWSAKAHSLYELGHYNEAVECFDKLLEIYPNNNYALEAKGHMLEKLGRKEEALKCYNQAIDSNSQDVSSSYRKGNLLLEKGDVHGALQSYNTVVENTPGFEDAWYKIGQLLLKQNKTREAEECFSWIARLNPDNIMAREALSSLGTGDENILSEPPVINEGRFTSRAEIDDVRQEAKDFDSGDNSKTPELKQDVFTKSSLLFNEKLHKVQHQMNYPKAPTAEPNTLTPDMLETNIDAYFNDLMEMAEKPAVMEKNISLGLKPQADFLIPVEERVSDKDLVDMGRHYLERGDNDKALKCFNRALESNPQFWDAWSLMGDVLMEMGKIEEASICFRKAMLSSVGKNGFVVSDGGSKSSRLDDEWKESLQSFIDIIDNDPSVKEMKIAQTHSLSAEATDFSEVENQSTYHMIASSADIDDDSQDMDELNFECPLCGTGVSLEEPICSNCLTAFEEEDFQNENELFDDFLFFERLKSTFNSQTPFFIHFDGDCGRIRFLENSEVQPKGKPHYVILKGDIEKISMDYSFNSDQS